MGSHNHKYSETQLVSVTQGLPTLLGMWLVMMSNIGMSQTRSQVYGSALTRETMTAYVQDDIAINTYESEAAGSKEIAQTSTWSVGTYAGEGRGLGIYFRSSDNVVPFALNKSYLRANFKDTVMQARIGWVYPAIAAGLTEIKTTSTDNGNFDLYGASVGAGLGVYIPLFSRGVFFVNGMLYKTPNAWDKSGKPVELGNRLEKDIGASIDVLTEFVDLMVGYRTRNYDVTTDGVKYKEAALGAYAGLKLGLYF